MGLSNRTRTYLKGEGIVQPDDLAEFTKKEAWAQIVENCKRPPQIPGAGGALVNQQPFLLPAKSLLRLKTASLVADYYLRTLRDLTAGNMVWTRLNNFQVEYDTLLERKKTNDELTLPKISRNLPIVPFFEPYDSFVEEFIGQANCPLAWIYREEVDVPAPAPDLLAGQPYSEGHGSVAGRWRTVSLMLTLSVGWTM